MKIDGELKNMSFGKILPNIGETFMTDEDDILYVRIPKFDDLEYSVKHIYIFDLKENCCGVLNLSKVSKFHMIKTKVVLDKES